MEKAKQIIDKTNVTEENLKDTDEFLTIELKSQQLGQVQACCNQEKQQSMLQADQFCYSNQNYRSEIDRIFIPYESYNETVVEVYIQRRTLIHRNYISKRKQYKKLCKKRCLLNERKHKPPAAQILE
ncbi:UNKNOWN [Stylonychia lemnae]|uniref:Uncharacterized protein n=1 Tax=Stylonychia lemnae TaxID=5949 RepID=A0A078A127_STYLE|nr:UNKNOWN [Stylonychia lemnae]|eukprot:CDW75931.1 UNKNOWN [Stylonychia lemnae]